MDLINAITNKKDWQVKFKDAKILNKWLNEFISQGANKQIIKKVIELLDMSLEEKDYYDYDINKYDWILNITTNFNEIGLLRCDGCECLNCNDCPYASDYEDNCHEYCECEEDCDGGDNCYLKLEYRKILQMKCTCNTVLNLNKIKQTYLEKFIVIKENLVDAKVKKQFIEAVNSFTKTKEIDYHPGTNNTVVDILHPSLYCYVDGVTMVRKFGSEKPSLFQWIPANYSTKDNKFISRINNCNQEENKNLYETIETIFSNFLLQFQIMFNNLNINNRMDEKINLDNYDNLQVIVKIGSTQLTCEKSKSTGTGWHLEGIREENIIGTGIYYYDINNITDSHLSFRTVIDHPYMHYPQGHNKFVEAHYGMTRIENGRWHEIDTTIPLGKVKTTENICLVFPNFLQHKVEEFELMDKTKEGNRNILVFFLIDPRKKIISTSDIINNEVTLEEAKIYRELLMFQRKYEVKDQKNFFERGWSLCEH